MSCQVEPICLNCDEQNTAGINENGSGGEAEMPDSGGQGPIQQGQGGQVEPEKPSCIPTHVYDLFCNQIDDDCDGITDEEESEHKNRLQNDPLNCGICERSCDIENAIPSCTEGACVIHQCGRGYYDLDSRNQNGCEYKCLKEDLSKVCEQIPQSCKTENQGTELCDGRYEVQNGQIQTLSPGIDNDCDGTIDEGFEPQELLTDIFNCGGCGNNCLTQLSHLAEDHTHENPTVACLEGSCVALRCEDRFNTIQPETGEHSSSCQCHISGEVCDGRQRDDDCDGNIDEDPVNLNACGNIPEECALSAELCTCQIGQEICNDQGRRACENFQGPVPEQCDGLDNDCDGKVDEVFLDENGNLASISHCGACNQPCIKHGNQTAQCVESDNNFQCLVECPRGFYDISQDDPQGGPSPCEYACTRQPGCEDGNCDDLCNGIDDDCDGQTDENSDLEFAAFDQANCLTEGVCAEREPHCTNGILDCGYPAQELGAQAPWFGADNDCDNADNDCNGTVDDHFPERGEPCTTPNVVGSSNYVGECTRHGQWVCSDQHQSLVCGNLDAGGLPLSFEICDTKDNDCDGQSDENIGVNLGQTPEQILESSRSRGIELVGPLTTELQGQEHSFYVMAFEASRPDATLEDQGTPQKQNAQNPEDSISCSRQLVLPNTQQMTWKQAQTSCCALNGPDGDPTCQQNFDGGAPSGWHLCKQEELAVACQGPPSIRPGAQEQTVCQWSYTEETDGNERTIRCDCDDPEKPADCLENYTRTRCADAYVDCDPNQPGKQDCTVHPLPTQSFSECHMSWGAQGRVFDLTGNAAEWTSTLAQTNTVRTENGDGSHTYFKVDDYKIFGGSHMLTAGGLRCDADFRVGASVSTLENVPENPNQIPTVESVPSDFQFRTDTGYRCCYTP